MSIDLQGPGRGTPLIPGAYERNTLTYRQPGSMGADTSVAVPIGSGSMDAATIAEREREGGGAPSQRRRTVQVQARTVSPEEDASAERWRQWQLRNAVTSRTDAKRARIAFTVLFAGLGAWLGLPLLAPLLWP